MADPALLDWCKQHRIQTSKVVPGYVAEGWRGIVATDTIEPDTVVMRVPELLLMSVVSARQDPQVAAILQHHQLNSHQILSIHLLCEAAKGTSSFWHPYIQQLPQHFTTFMAWPAAAAAALQLPHAQEVATAAQTKARSEWTTARIAMQELGLPKKFLSWRGWCWASSCVLSRTMYHPADPDTGCLTPLADLHNYQPPPSPHERRLGEAAQQLVQQQHGTADTGVTLQQQQPHVMLQAVEGAAGQPTSSSGQLDHQAQPSVEQASSQVPPHEGRLGQECQGMPLHWQPQQEQQQECACVTVVGSRSQCASSGDSASAAVDTGPCVVPDVGDDETNNSSRSRLCGDGHFDPADKVYKIIARRRYNPGDQVFLCYGRHTNLDLLELYGFMLDDNPHDQALLPLDTIQHNMQQLLKQRQRQQQGEGRQWKRQQQQPVMCRVDVGAADSWVSVRGYPSWELLRALRLAAATPSEVRQLGHLALEGSPISLSSERLVLSCLLMSCQQTLEALPTTAAQDQVLLKELAAAAATACSSCPEASPGSKADSKDKCQREMQQQQQQHDGECSQLAVKWRLCYKQSLAKCINQCREALVLLEGIDT